MLLIGNRLKPARRIREGSRGTLNRRSRVNNFLSQFYIHVSKNATKEHVAAN